MTKTKASVQPEPMTSPVVEVFESAGDRDRREWYASSGDWAFGVLQILQGSRRNEVSLSELWASKVYARSDQRERDALRFGANQSTRSYPIEENDKVILKLMDDFLIAFADGTAPLGHRNIVEAIRGIPARVRRAQEVDAALFSHEQFRERVLFSWIWDAKVNHGSI